MERQRMSEADRDKYLSTVKMKITDPKLIKLIEEDLDNGLTKSEIDDYTDRHLSFEQQKLISGMYRKGYPRPVVAVIGDTHADAEMMKVGMELYDNQVGIKEIKVAMAEAKSASDLKKAFAQVLDKVQKTHSITPEVTESEPLPKEQEKELYAMIQELTDAIESQSIKHDTIVEIQKSMESIRIDEAVVKNLTELNDKLSKENQELSTQLGSKQDEITKGLQNISKLRNEVENAGKEIIIMQDRIQNLEEQLAQKDEIIYEQGQAMLAKDAVILKHNSKETSEDRKADMTENTPEVFKGMETLEDKEKKEEKMVMPEGAVPVYYAMTFMRDKKVLQRTDLDYVNRKPSVFDSIMSRFAFNRKSHRDLVQMVIKKELSSEQVNEIKSGLEKGLDEEQLELIINKNLEPDRIRSIVGFAALQNSLKAERGEKE